MAAGAALPPLAPAWDLRTHRFVNEHAVDLAPEPLRCWLAAHRSEIADRGVEPDTVRRKRYGREESIRHFVNLDLYGPPPFAMFPASRAEAEARWGPRVVAERGTLPWTLDEHRRRLTRELRRGSWRKALRTAGHSGHYLADAWMPLHATRNHDGQLTGNDGLHARIEREVVGPRLGEWKDRILRAADPASERPLGLEDFFEVLRSSHARVATLLAADDRTAGLPETSRAPELADRLEGVLAERIGGAISQLASFWAGAWAAAGRPDPPADCRTPLSSG